MINYKFDLMEITLAKSGHNLFRKNLLKGSDIDISNTSILKINTSSESQHI